MSSPLPASKRSACDQRHLVLLGWMVAGLLLLSETVGVERWKIRLPHGPLPAG